MKPVESTVLLVDDEFRHTLAAGDLFDRLEHPAERLLGSRIDEAFPEGAARTLCDRYRDALDGETRTFRLACWGHELLVQTAPIRDTEGEITDAMGLFLDASALERYTGSLETLRRHLDDLLSAETDAELLETFVEIAGDRLQLSEAVAYRFDEEAAVLRPEAASERPEPEPVSPGDRTVWEAFKRETAVFGGDRSGGDRAEDRNGVRFAVPFGGHGAFAARLPDGSDDDPALETVRVLCVIVGVVLDRFRNERELRERDWELRQRTQQLERTERGTETLGAVVRAAVSAETLDALDAAVCDSLLQHEAVEFAWVGRLNRTDVTLQPRTCAGSERGYLEEGPIELDGSDEPAARAALDRETTVVGDVASEIGSERWRSEALERGFRSAMAVPLAHNGLLYGVVSLYADRPDAFEEVAPFADDIGRVVGYASTAIRSQNALLSHASTELDVEITAPACFFVRFVRETGTGVSFESIASTDDGGSLVYVTADAPDLLFEYAQESITVESVRTLEDDPDDVLEVQFDDSFIGSFLSTHGIALERASATPEEVRITVSIPPSMSPRQALDAIQTEYPDSRLLAKREPRPEAPGGATTRDSVFDRLTDRQREIVERAYRAGYFETPKQATGEALAAEMDISTSAFHNHLRAAESELFAWLFDTREG
jgi:predicted DNA binding protein